MQQQFQCPRCNALVAYGTQSCQYCGQPLIWQAQQSAINKSGYYNGRHYTTYVDDVNRLKKSEQMEEAERLLFRLVQATEDENNIENLGVAPWYYEELMNRNYSRCRGTDRQHEHGERCKGSEVCGSH